MAAAWSVVDGVANTPRSLRASLAGKEWDALDGEFEVYSLPHELDRVRAVDVDTAFATRTGTGAGAGAATATGASPILKEAGVGRFVATGLDIRPMNAFGGVPAGTAVPPIFTSTSPADTPSLAA